MDQIELIKRALGVVLCDDGRGLRLTCFGRLNACLKRIWCQEPHKHMMNKKAIIILWWNEIVKGFSLTGHFELRLNLSRNFVELHWWGCFDSLRKQPTLRDSTTGFPAVAYVAGGIVSASKAGFRHLRRLVSPRNGIWETSEEIPYWHRITT